MFKCYRQLEQSDCGLTCIRMMARHYGKRVPLSYIREHSDLSRLGMSIKDMTLCLASVGMDSAPVRINMEEARRMPLPAILYWQQKHFVVLYKISNKGNRWHIADPARGKVTYSTEDFFRYWIPEGDKKSIAILAEPNETFAEREYESSSPLKRMFAYVGNVMFRHKRSFLMIILMSLLIMGADLCVPLLLRTTIDEGIGLKDLGLVMTLLLGQLAMMTGSLVSSGIVNIILTRLGLNIDIGMVSDFLKKLTRFPLSFFDRRVSSEFIQKIGDQSAIKDFLVSFPNTMLSMLLNLVVFSILLCHYSTLIFGIFVILSLIELGWSMLFLSRRKSLNFAYFTDAADNRNNAYEMLNGMPEIKVNNAEDVRLGKWQQIQRRLNKTSLKGAWINLYDSGGRNMISNIKGLLVTGISAAMVIEGDMTMGIMMTLGYITGRLAQPFNILSSMILSVQNALLSYERIDEVMTDDSLQRGDSKYSEPSITLRHLWYKYPGAGSPYVIKDFSLEVEAGKTTALVGESGCGKTTLIKLMLGFYVPAKGELLLSGMPVAEVDNSDWLRHCGVVMQSGQIFTGSILENIALSDETPDKERALQMLETVGLRHFVEKLPMGINTRIGVSGIEMSGGQKQRLMIARALYKDPDILFLDEATSSLDANNERTITDNIRDIGRGKTIVIAAHRLSTVMNADRIVFIKDGEISEQGTHDQLLALRGDYWKLVKNQLNLSISTK